MIYCGYFFLLVAFVPHSTLSFCIGSNQSRRLLILSKMSEWGDFQAMENDLLDDSNRIDTRDYATEHDSPELKAQVGRQLEAPTIDHDVPPLFVPLGSRLDLSEEIVVSVLAACRDEIGTMFGYTAENRGVGITGGVDFVELDGPTVVLRLHGRFWHERTTVLRRVAAYLVGRIPEIIDVTVHDEWQLTQEANDAAI